MLAMLVRLSSDVAGPIEAARFGRLHLPVARNGDSESIYIWRFRIDILSLWYIRCDVDYRPDHRFLMLGE